MILIKDGPSKKMWAHGSPVGGLEKNNRGEVKGSPTGEDLEGVTRLLGRTKFIFPLNLMALLHRTLLF